MKPKKPTKREQNHPWGKWIEGQFAKSTYRPFRFMNTQAPLRKG